MPLYTIRQYRPAFFTGFTDAVVEHVAVEDLMNPAVLPWLKNFQHDADGGFLHFYAEPYVDDALLISARYANGKHWVAAIAQPESKP